MLQLRTLLQVVGSLPAALSCSLWLIAIGFAVYLDLVSHLQHFHIPPVLPNAAAGELGEAVSPILDSLIAHVTAPSTAPFVFQKKPLSDNTHSPCTTTIENAAPQLL